MKIHWLIPGIYHSQNELRQSNVASTRMRVAVSIDAMMASGLNSVTCGDNISKDTEVIFVGKIGGDCNNGRAKHWLKQINEFKNRHAKVVVDFTDNHAGYDLNMSGFYRFTLPIADAITVSSQTLANQLNSNLSAKLTIIDEPIEFLPLKIRSAFVNPPTLLWFGHATNLKYFLSFLQAKKHLIEGLNVLVLSNPEGLEFIRQSEFFKRFNLDLFIWSVDEMIKAARIADISVLPGDPSDLRKSGVSANRLITSLALGLPTAANLMHSYCPYSEYFVDIQSSTFSEMLGHPGFFAGKTLKAQNELIPFFSPEAIRRKWIDFLKTLDVAPPPKIPSFPPP